MDILSSIESLLMPYLNAVGILEGTLWLSVIRSLIILSIVGLLHLMISSVVTPLIRKVVIKIKHSLTTYLLKHHFFINLLRIVPLVLVYHFSIFFNNEIFRLAAVKLTNVILIYYILILFYSVLNAVYDQLDHKKVTRNLPITQFIQLLKSIGFLVAIIVFFSVMLDKSPVYLLSGLGAISAVLIFAMQDSISSLVAGIQVATQKLFKVGDWVIVDDKIDGEIKKISLSSCTVVNWDNTEVTFPVYRLIKDTVQNYVPMYGTVRRLKCSMCIDMHSIRFLSHDELSKLTKVNLLTEYIGNKQLLIAHNNHTIEHDDVLKINGRGLTNIGTFRYFIKAFLKSQENINQKSTLLVRQLQPSEKGLPIEIYCFTKPEGTGWVEYEEQQADLFDYLLSVAPEFGLKIFQYDAQHNTQRN